jgi:hypothetical protein
MFKHPLEFDLQGEDGRISFVDPLSTSKMYAKETNPFDVLTGAITTGEETLSDEALSPSSMWSDSTRPSSSPSTTSKTQLLDANIPTRRPLAKANTFPIHRRESRSKVQTQRELKRMILDLLPMEDHAKTFRLEGSFMYATMTRNLPRYQLRRDFDRDGSTSKLHMRAVLPRETRSHSVSAAHMAGEQHIHYNDDETLYSMDAFEMRGKKADTLPGSIQMTSGESLWGGQWTRIWHVTRCKAQHHVCDYRGECEPEKHLLYCVKKGVWEDADGVVVAREDSVREGLGAWVTSELFAQKTSVTERTEDLLEMTDEIENDRNKRDLVMACWVMKLWMAEQLRWGGN